MIEIKIDDNTSVFMEATSSARAAAPTFQGRHGPSSEIGIKEMAEDAVADLREITEKVGVMIARIRESTLNGFKDYQPDEFEIAFEFGVDFEKNVIIAKGGLNSSFKVSATWKKG